MRMQKYSERMGMLVLVAFLMGMGGATSESSAAEAKYPDRLIQVVIGVDPGSATDMAFRPFVEGMQEYLGQPGTLLFKPGANGATAGIFVVNAKPDGYTLGGFQGAVVITNPLTMEKVGYTTDDFVPICRLAKVAVSLAVRTDSPWKTLRDFVEEAKKYPGKLTYATAGFLSNPHMAAEMFSKAAGIKLTHVPTKGATSALTALLGGHVNMVGCSPSSSFPHVRSGTLRIIGVFEEKRLEQFPDVPTFIESGYPVAFSIWYGLLAPKGTPKEVVNTIYKACEKVMADPRYSIKDRYEKRALTLAFLDPEGFANAIKKDREVMKEVIKEILQTTK
jgi:tripartite-type tricarboxylate transporter receptor subunit TctC